MIGFVYAIGDETGRVKIGWSGDPLRRLNKIGSDCSSVVTLLGLIPATQAQETEIQGLLKPWKVNREWFRLEGPVESFVDMLPRPEPRSVDLHPNVNPLRAYRADQKVTLEQLADMFGVNKTTVLRLEEGQIPAERVLAVSKKTGIPPYTLRPDLYPRERWVS